MKKFIATILIVLISFTSYSEEIKIGIVDVNKILKEAPQTLAANKKLEKEFNSRTTKLKDKVSSLQSDEKKYQKVEYVHLIDFRQFKCNNSSIIVYCI